MRTKEAVALGIHHRKLYLYEGGGYLFQTKRGLLMVRKSVSITRLKL